MPWTWHPLTAQTSSLTRMKALPSTPKSLLLLLLARLPPEKSVEAQGSAQTTTSKEMRISVLKPRELNSANNPNELGKGFFPGAPRKYLSPAHTLTSVYETKNRGPRPPGFLTNKTWDNEICIVLVSKFVVICYSTKRKPNACYNNSNQICELYRLY